MSTAAPLADPICTHNVPLPTPEQLPNDLETLKRMLIEVMVTLHQERREKEQLQQRMKLLLQRLYGPRSERCNPDQNDAARDNLTSCTMHVERHCAALERI